MLEEGDDGDGEEEEEEAARWLLSLSEVAQATESPPFSSSPTANGEGVEKRATPATTSGGSFLSFWSASLAGAEEAGAERPPAGPSCIAASVAAGGHEKPRPLGQAMRSRDATQREEDNGEEEEEEEGAEGRRRRRARRSCCAGEDAAAALAAAAAAARADDGGGNGTETTRARRHVCLPSRTSDAAPSTKSRTTSS